MNKNEATFLAKVTAREMMDQVRDFVGEIVRQELPATKSKEEMAQTLSAIPTARPSRRIDGLLRRNRTFTPRSDLTKTFMESVKWRAGKGKQLGVAILVKPETQKTLVIEQYGVECSLLLKDMAQCVPCEFDSANVLVKPGTSPWRGFKTVPDILENVVAELKANGWQSKPKPQKVQLALADA